MGRLVGFSTHKLELGQSEHGPEWVEIRDQLSWGEDQVMLAAMFDVEKTAAGYEQTARLDYRTGILRAYVAGWQIFGDDGEKVPFSLEALARLDTPTCTTILAHIDAMSEGDQKKATTTAPSETPK